MNAMMDMNLVRHLDEMTPWNDRLHVLELIDVRDEAPEVKTFTFQTDTQTWFRYRPGQFITLELATPDGPIMRTYTLSSSPSRPFSIAVTAKAQAGSIGTRWMFDNLNPGAQVKAYGPAGDFTHHNHPASKYLFLSAGSGITPMMSMLRWFSDRAPWTDLAFVNCAQRPEDIIFRKELELLGTQMPGLTIGLLIEQRSASRESWVGHTGRLDATRMTLLSPDFNEREVFCCGPDGFMRSVRGMLRAAGFNMEHYHEESFGAQPVEIFPVPCADGIAAGNAGRTQQAAAVRFSLSDIVDECQPGQTVLQVARACGVRIPAACEAGLCGTCKVRKASGEVAMNHSGGILDEEIADGFILACCARPLTAIEVAA